jgi:2-keto-4-pentenoate hydratase
MSRCELLVAMMAALTWTPSQAACFSDAEVAALFDSYNKRQSAANPEGLSLADGECTREKFNKLLQAQMGAPVGYKAGLTNPAVQRRFEHDSPVWGALYAPCYSRAARWSRPHTVRGRSSRPTCLYA